MKFPILALMLAASLVHRLEAEERPNILWITSEDNAWHWLGCYGNNEARTPRLDSLAAGGLRFSHAYSNAPVCAVARSTILNGAHAVTQGTQHMRSRHPIPEEYKPHAFYLRELGYYCTNNLKTDYNFKGDDNAIWDDCSKTAHYRNRPDGKPFFAIFNLTVSHESSLFPDVIAANRERGIIPQTPRIPPDRIMVPPYLPDLPEIRSDIAIYQDNITALDTQVGVLLDELEKSGLAENTIIFYYGDHGGATPRGKRYLYDTGVRVPLLIHLPAKWRHLSPFPPATVINEPVSFVDLSPTLLSLVGLEKSAAMQGRAFLGPKRTEPPSDQHIFLYADRFDDVCGMRRGLTDGRWKYIRHFSPNLNAAPFSFYPLGQAGWSAWKMAWQSGKLKGPFKEIWESPQPVELLFDTAGDPWEMKNLATDPTQSERLQVMRQRLKETMIRALDIGLIPEPMFHELSAAQPVATYLAKRMDSIPALVSAAFTASQRDTDNLTAFAKDLTSSDPLIRFWAVQGCLVLGRDAGSCADTLVRLLDDPHSSIRVAAAHALYTLGREELGKQALLKEIEHAGNEASQLNVAHALNCIGQLDEISDRWVRTTIAEKSSGEIIRIVAERLQNQRE
jgi:N-sulfoglucosamine sulfohydrolase